MSIAAHQGDRQSHRFGKLPSAVVESGALHELDRRALNVYLFLVARSNGRTAEAREFVSTIADHAEASERTVQRRIDCLQRLGLIEVVVGGGRSRASRFRIVAEPRQAPPAFGGECSARTPTKPPRNGGESKKTPSVNGKKGDKSAGKPRQKRGDLAGGQKTESQSAGPAAAAQASGGGRPAADRIIADYERTAANADGGADAALRQALAPRNRPAGWSGDDVRDLIRRRAKTPAPA